LQSEPASADRPLHAIITLNPVKMASYRGVAATFCGITAAIIGRVLPQAGKLLAVGR
jgi:hypothetical protein